MVPSLKKRKERKKDFEPSRNYLRVPGYIKKDKKRQEKKRKNERRRNPYARVRRYKITSKLRLLVRGDPQDEGLRRLQPCARLSKLDQAKCKYAGITSTRLHRQRQLTMRQMARLWTPMDRIHLRGKNGGRVPSVV